MTTRIEGFEILDAAFANRSITAKVVDVDYYRPKGILVETDYVILVESGGGGGGGGDGGGEVDATADAPASFRYMISKTYHHFRKLVEDLRRSADLAYDHHHRGSVKSREHHRAFMNRIAKFCGDLNTLINSEQVKYLRKVNFANVRSTAKKRTAILNRALELIINEFPREESESFLGVKEMMRTIETFFLTDHVVEEGKETSTMIIATETVVREERGRTGAAGATNRPGANNRGKGPQSNGSSSRRKSFIEPISNKKRRSVVDRAKDERVLADLGQSGSLLVREDGEGPAGIGQHQRPTTTSAMSKVKAAAKFLATTMFLVGITYALHVLSESSLAIDKDVALLICFACFCIGRNCGRVGALHFASSDGGGLVLRGGGRRATFSPAVLDRAVDKLARCPSAVIRKSMLAHAIQDAAYEVEEMELEMASINTPLDRFKYDEDVNCWSEPPENTFVVRGPRYLEDKKKVQSGPYLFPIRGVDLFLTDDCPENIGRNEHILGGALRDVPTFVINFRLPWGALVLYYEIPARFLPFLRKRYLPSTHLPSTTSMSAAERTLCKFFLSDDEHRNQRFKLIPMVHEGPRIVRASMRGKPALIGSKLPVGYTYQAAEPSARRAEYFEVDLDIAALSRARKILSLCRSCTQSLTIDVAFVIQGNSREELPEQLLCGARLHKIDLLNASILPPMAEGDALGDIVPVGVGSLDEE